MTDSHLAAAAPIPPYLTAALAQRFGPLAEEIAGGYPERRPVSLRVNTLKTDAASMKAALTEAGIRFETLPWYADALVLPEAGEGEVRTLPLYSAGEIYLQSLSAMVPALLFDLKRGESVLDMAAAPGGKSIQMAALSGGQISLTVCERDPIRFDRLKSNLALQGVRNVTALRQDARELDDFFRFSHILLDAPCSGSGTLLLSGKPRRMEADWVRRLTRTQTALIRKALRLLSPGGDLVYATCSILEEENENVVRAALSGGGCELLPVPEALSGQLPTLPVSLEGTLCIRPTALYEGFFAARLRKTK
ncbi:MAG: RsmB/NOP family class I SAM-dependent RNA methyltransferase [Clostridia bacterium]|nr:RsmB/NOP family class I SAM-dependent RNA methyltransferase [Clostridia bacterium]